MNTPEILSTATSRRSVFKIAGAMGLATAFAASLSACSDSSSNSGGGDTSSKTIEAGIS